MTRFKGVFNAKVNIKNGKQEKRKNAKCPNNETLKK